VVANSAPGIVDVDLHSAVQEPSSGGVASGCPIVESYWVIGSISMISSSARNTDIIMVVTDRTPSIKWTLSNGRLGTIAPHRVHPDWSTSPRIGVIPLKAVNSRVAKFMTYHVCIEIVKAMITDGAPLVRMVDLHSASVGIRAVHQANSKVICTHDSSVTLVSAL
jgi:hypothetical protein